VYEKAIGKAAGGQEIRSGIRENSDDITDGV
jgi:hypothetical protein